MNREWGNSNHTDCFRRNTPLLGYQNFSWVLLSAKFLVAQGNYSICPIFFLTTLARFPQQTYKISSISPANLNFLRVRGSFLQAVLVRSYALCYPAQADSGFFTQLFAAFGITFLSSFVFLQSFRVWRYVRSLYKLMSFLVPPQKSCLHCTCSIFASTTARLLIFVSRPKTSLDLWLWCHLVAKIGNSDAI